MVYPVEWISEGPFPDDDIRRALPQYYVRTWGKDVVRCFPTLVHASIFEEWFADDLATGLRECVKCNDSLRIFPSDGYTRLVEGKLKALSPTHRRVVGQYVMHALYPSELDLPRVYSMQLGIPLVPAVAAEDLKAMLA